MGAMKTPPPYTIIHEDDELVVVNKASGIAVLADRWDDSRERLDELLNSAYAADIKAGKPPRIPFPHRVFVIHRIDRDTSGLVAFAKTAACHARLSRAFESRSVHKSYLAVIRGRPAWQEERCELPLRPDGDREHRTIIDKGRGKASSTTFRVIGSVEGISLLEASPESGRTHQIRVHLAAMGFPIACDPLYGNTKGIKLSEFKRSWRGDSFDERPLLDRLGLHAWKLSIPSGDESGNDGTSATQTFVAEPPKDLAALLRQMEKVSKDPFLYESAE